MGLTTEQKIRNIIESFSQDDHGKTTLFRFDQWLTSPQARTLIDELEGMGGKQSGIDLVKLQNEIDALLDSETEESFNEWFKSRYEKLSESTPSQSQGDVLKEDGWEADDLNEIVDKIKFLNDNNKTKRYKLVEIKNQ